MSVSGIKLVAETTVQVRPEGAVYLTNYKATPPVVTRVP